MNSILNGDGQTGETDGNGESVSGTTGFHTSDFYTLTITADNGNTKEVKLADYTDADENEHFYLDSWQWVDLKELGTVKELTFSLKASRKNELGYTTPLYFCMDNFNGTRPETERLSSLYGQQNTVRLTSLFETTTKTGTVSYTFADELDSEQPTMTIVGDVLTITSDQAELDFYVTVKATQNGSTQYVRLHVVRSSSVPTTIDGIAVDENIEGRYGADGKTLTNGSRQKGVQIVRQKDGSVRKVLR